MARALVLWEGTGCHEEWENNGPELPVWDSKRQQRVSVSPPLKNHGRGLVFCQGAQKEEDYVLTDGVLVKRPRPPPPKEDLFGRDLNSPSPIEPHISRKKRLKPPHASGLEDFIEEKNRRSHTKYLLYSAIASFSIRTMIWKFRIDRTWFIPLCVIF
ncbi:hypothetical protein JTE90_005074 [Oedothorax gibbosus]|uniref:Uncharacterized protein n=1 Tax=Oedothorax gibbosus TaxID=931172 RepID=A0AAV6VDP7_9ARAC|nr:hypothetical protein JTE90_005074 [Oedothorax gibbosus]